MKLPIKVSLETGVIEDARFKTFGCGSAIASSSLATERLKGKTIEEAGKIKNTDIVAELKLPPVKTHCSVLAEDAIKAALADFRERYGTVGAAATVYRSRRAPARAGFRTATANLRRLRLRRRSSLWRT